MLFSLYGNRYKLHFVQLWLKKKRMISFKDAKCDVLNYLREEIAT